MFFRSKSSKIKTNESNIENIPILDEDEQDKIANEIKLQAITQSFNHRKVFQYVFYTITVIYVICIYFTIQSPYELEHQKLFYQKVSILNFHLFYIGSIYCKLVAANIVIVSSLVN